MGCLLVANGAYLYPDGNPTGDVFVYEAREAGTEPLSSVSNRVVGCRFAAAESLPCILARQVLTDGPIRFEVEADPGFGFTDYRYLEVDGSVYRPAPHVTNDTLVLGFEAVDDERVRRNLTTELSLASDPVRAAVADGRVRTAEPIPDDERYVRDDGTYYRIELVRSGEERTSWGLSSPPVEQILLLRVGGWVLGLALVWTAGRRVAS